MVKTIVEALRTFQTRTVKRNDRVPLRTCHCARPFFCKMMRETPLRAPILFEHGAHDLQMPLEMLTATTKS